MDFEPINHSDAYTSSDDTDSISESEINAIMEKDDSVTIQAPADQIQYRADQILKKYEFLDKKKELTPAQRAELSRLLVEVKIKSVDIIVYGNGVNGLRGPSSVARTRVEDTDMVRREELKPFLGDMEKLIEASENGFPSNVKTANKKYSDAVEELKGLLDDIRTLEEGKTANEDEIEQLNKRIAAIMRGE